MIEISFGKLLLLAVIALIVLGPEKLPHAARTAGALLRRLRSGWDSVRAEVERELEIEEIRRVAREAAAQAEQAQAKLDLAQARINEAAHKAQNVAGSDVASLVDDPATSGASAVPEARERVMTGPQPAHPATPPAGARPAADAGTGAVSRTDDTTPANGEVPRDPS